jgi:hypothetical protein
MQAILSFCHDLQVKGGAASVADEVKRVAGNAADSLKK